MLPNQTDFFRHLQLTKKIILSNNGKAFRMIQGYGKGHAYSVSECEDFRRFLIERTLAYAFKEIHILDQESQTFGLQDTRFIDEKLQNE